ncbi:hypothetical protein EDD93_2119 [Streptomyces sp. 840.1]|uniref:DUF3592 domain-containing protein n=1 Tax=Streptomyces sp. 840.1 TaxID=2485152 RepID=UPI000FC02F01|nr:DUF3592 domain-containing protein [Streptomyces sp. 840.1]ROQ67674.1 hypothetical protein EDD93_2119 [Streptomyces sp. 840.1]
MTTMPGLPSLVLRGSSATARFGDGFDYVQWEQGGRVIRIPLEAIEAVRSLDRSFEVILTTTVSDRPADVYGVHHASAAAVDTFSAAVRARLPERAAEGPRVDGRDLIADVSEEHSRKPSRRLLVVTLIAVLAAVDATVGALRGSGWVVVLPFFQLFACTGAFMALTLGRGLYDGLRLSRHGITVMAELDHYTDSTRVYRYADHEGGSHFFREPAGGQQLELSYDPRDPSRASARQPLYGQVMMALISAIGLGMACGGFGFTGYQLFLALLG